MIAAILLKVSGWESWLQIILGLVIGGFLVGFFTEFAADVAKAIRRKASRA